MIDNKKAILIVSFGSSIEEARVNAIEPIETLIKENFLDYQIERAFTSNSVIKKLKETIGLAIDTPEEGLHKLIEKGFQEIIIQPLHILAGYEFDKIKKTILDMNHLNVEIKLGKPLLYEEIDYLKVIESLNTQLPELEEKQVVLLIGHGTNHPANSSYDKLQAQLKSRGLPVIVGTIEVGIDPIITELEAGGYEDVVLMPFLLVAGEHVQNDIFGDDNHSWKSRLISSGYHVKAYYKGLGENPSFQQLYLQRVQELSKA